MTGEVHAVSINVGAISNETVPLFPAPSAASGGGITILEAHVIEGGSGGTTASSFRLLKGTVSGGTFTANGTIDSAAVGGTASVFIKNIAKSWTIANPYVSPGEWLAVIEGNVQAAPTVTRIAVSYVVGR